MYIHIYILPIATRLICIMDHVESNVKNVYSKNIILYYIITFT